MHGTAPKQGLMPRATVEDIVRQRDRALALFEQAHSSIANASDAIAEARAAAFKATPGQTGFRDAPGNSYNRHAKEDEARFLHGLKTPERDHFLSEARRLTDINVWAYVVEATDLERLMDKKAKDDLRQQLLTDPPPATVANITATLERFVLDADTIFRRGIAVCFSKLSRRFRSHDGWKIGSRVILERALNEYGGWSYYSNEKDTLQDIERTFFVIDGKTPPPNYAGIVGAVESQRGFGFGRRVGYVESDYFRVRTFMNGNCHVWFKRDDLLRKVNKLLAEYYGEVIPEEREPDADDGLNTPKTSLAKHYGFFPTPDDLVARILEYVPTYRDDDKPLLRVLEPSAGTGNIARALVDEGCDVDCIEIQADRAELLRRDASYGKVYCCDFLAISPETTGLYDRVVMNPPFDRERDIDHVVHALKFLKPNGCLVAIMSAGTEFRETKKSIAFRAMIEKMGGKTRDLPAGSFSSVGTNVNTIMLKVWNGNKHWTW